MINLTNLYLQANYLTELPETIKYLVSLETLDVSQNCLAKLPDSIGDLTSLKKLILTGNKLVSLPESLGSLRNLTSLQLSNNNIQVNFKLYCYGIYKHVVKLLPGQNILQFYNAILCKFLFHI